MRFTKSLTLASTLAFLGLSALSVGGCADNRTTLYVNHVMGFDGADEDCSPDPQLSGGIFLSKGRFDPLSPKPYTAWLVVANQLVPLGDNDRLVAETSRIQLQGAEVRVTPPNGGTDIPAYTTYFSGTIQPDPSSAPGLASIGVPLMESGDLATGNYLVEVRVFGETLGGTDVESGPFIFPIEVLSPGSQASCEDLDVLADAQVLHPCMGMAGQDGFRYSCSLFMGRPDDGGIYEFCDQACSVAAP